MITELEPRKFRRGENANKPLGGNIADEPFPKALRALEVSKGLESQSDLTRALGKNSNSAVSAWFRGEHVPSPESFGELLILFKPNDVRSEIKVERFVDSWTKRRTEGKGLHGGSRPGRYAHLRKTSETPFGRWMESFCKGRGIAMIEFLKRSKVGVRPNTRDSFGDTTFHNILKNAQDALGLSEEEVKALSKAIVQTIKQREEDGHRFKNHENGKEVRKAQKKLGYVTYNREQAGKKLGVSWDAVNLKLKKLNLPSELITEKNLKLLRREFDKTRSFREKQKKTLNRKKLLLE